MKNVFTVNQRILTHFLGCREHSVEWLTLWQSDEDPSSGHRDPLTSPPWTFFCGGIWSRLCTAGSPRRWRISRTRSPLPFSTSTDSPSSSPGRWFRSRQGFLSVLNWKGPTLKCFNSHYEHLLPLQLLLPCHFYRKISIKFDLLQQTQLLFDFHK